MDAQANPSSTKIIGRGSILSAFWAPASRYSTKEIRRTVAYQHRVRLTARCTLWWSSRETRLRCQSLSKALSMRTVMASSWINFKSTRSGRHRRRSRSCIKSSIASVRSLRTTGLISSPYKTSLRIISSRLTCFSRIARFWLKRIIALLRCLSRVSRRLPASRLRLPRPSA